MFRTRKSQQIEVAEIIREVTRGSDSEPRNLPMDYAKAILDEYHLIRRDDLSSEIATHTPPANTLDVACTGCYWPSHCPCFDTKNEEGE